MCYLFVYGTLQPEFQNPVTQFLLENAEVVGKGFIFGKLYDIGDYPGVIIDNNSKVFGTIFKVKNEDSVLAILDNYEEVGNNFVSPNEYFRTKVSVYINDSKALISWVYLYDFPVDALKHITSGSYLEYIRDREV